MNRWATELIVQVYDQLALSWIMVALVGLVIFFLAIVMLNRL
jgi:hypothetical protein